MDAQRRNVDRIHERVGLLLQIRAESAGEAEAHLPRAELRHMIHDRLIEEEYSQDKAAQMAGRLLVWPPTASCPHRAAPHRRERPTHRSPLEAALTQLAQNTPPPTDNDDAQQMVVDFVNGLDTHMWPYAAEIQQQLHHTYTRQPIDNTLIVGLTRPQTDPHQPGPC